MPRSGDTLDEPALDHFDVTVLTDPVGGVLPTIVDCLIASLSGLGGSGLAGPKAVVRVTERATGRVVLDIPCGTNGSLAMDVADSVRGDMARQSAGEFLDEYRLRHSFESTRQWRRAYLGVGSNLGDRLAHLQFAVDSLSAANVVVVDVSHVYETLPVGGPPQPEYLNAVLAVDTILGAHELLELAQRLEREAQRVRGERWGPRTLDVDILILGDEQVHDPDLEIPHPRMHTRGFVLAPLHDFLPPGVIPEPPGGWPGVRRTDLSLALP